MNIPSELKYTKEHEWVRIEDKIATIGVTDYAQTELTDITFFELPEIGREVKQMEEIGVIETSKAVSEIYSPVSGKVIEVHAALDDTPDTLNSDPYGEGWLVKIEISDEAEVEQLLSADA
ncbi:MAG TPA: glycine cleavage system protein GcvH, partial [candidate division Zixibacteria bacterium]|nr:glycine cleavage system protein GcvH [candidate division Zixibacteria bacterium]